MRFKKQSGEQSWVLKVVWTNEIHCIAGKFDGELSLVVWVENAKLKSTNIIYTCNALGYTVSWYDLAGYGAQD